MAEEKNNIEEIVGEQVIGNKPMGIKGIVIGNDVFEAVIGGKGRQIGYVKDGIAYEMVIGGPTRIIGSVEYNYPIK